MVFNNISVVVVSIIGGVPEVQTRIRIRTHNLSGDMHWLNK
jgi:hypothetical protein